LTAAAYRPTPAAILHQWSSRSGYKNGTDLTSYAEFVPEEIRQLEVRVRDGVPTLLINGVDVVTPAEVTMPAFSQSFRVAWGAAARTPPVTAVFERVELHELGGSPGKDPPRSLKERRVIPRIRTTR
jgi:hypothetical protein